MWAVGRAGVNNLFPEHNSATIGNILMILGRISRYITSIFNTFDEILLVFKKINILYLLQGCLPSPKYF